ncbi:4Fe-4S ferredoxin iron-sulfur binding domain protein [Thermoanaerobacter mathranii subsp. mathranii str. A3]|jgi:ferredoxin|uniref:Ferredoxin n=3 Tax=Thermoanaerobacter TaxID=1754 RepID=A0A1M4WKN8_9THEO|nr:MULTISPECIES: ferredoxin [Thermoanaerobacter]ABY92588.1 4Fe-4S ferredoxin, iron-sulfur binding domain protein [Thermoanaerobacter sp. X514]ADD02818.1 4Fe-4S ferredoxin iron-sulfur binding domain protein [Thermoanaerobacter italicus Ab9]ADH61281.1 4Fe-4S ferredoxin iron-sulfur binding domain protein [Thermoanaerobacter mathranii subsp. mathranii str. A3]SHE81720.1 ferredoxin [Thermoanaerobacter uzonensis DSM 18761]
MKVYVDQDECIACGVCIDMCPDVFDWNDEGKSHVIVDEVPADLEDCVQDAMSSCPTEAIKEE